MTDLLDLALLIASAGASLAGCFALAMSQPRNRRRVYGHGRKVHPPRLLRPAGWALILVSLPLSAARDGLSFAAVTWPLIVAAAAFSAAMWLAFYPLRASPKQIDERSQRG